MDDLSPIVSTYANFDSVLVPADHVSRSANDTYYVTKGSVLRCHTSAHQLELLKHGHKRFLVTGMCTDVIQLTLNTFPSLSSSEKA